MLSKYALDTYVAPHLSELTVVGATDLRNCTDQYGYWVVNFLLNATFRVTLGDRWRQMSMHFLRKTEGAFQEYQAAREHLAAYLARPGEAVSAYFHALRQFEVAAILAYHAYDTVGSIIQERLFVKSDESPLQRLNRLQNVVKHANKELVPGGIPESITIPIWLTDCAMVSHDTSLEWTEFGEIMLGLAKLAERVSNPPVPHLDRPSRLA